MAKKSKYRAKITYVDNIRFASKKEAVRYMILKDMEKKGDISNLELQPAFVLQSCFKRSGELIPAIEYVADFMYSKGEKNIVEDVKGFKTPVYNIKRKLFLKKYPEYDFREVI